MRNDKTGPQTNLSSKYYAIVQTEARACMPTRLQSVP